MKHSKHFLLVFILLFAFGKMQAANKLAHIEPAFWWVGMKEQKLQILLHGNNIAAAKPSLSYAGVLLTGTDRTPNKNYLFLNLLIDGSATAGVITITLGAGFAPIKYELKARDAKAKAQGYDQHDAIYLIMPDRFANGNPKNDFVAGMLEKPQRG